MIGAVSDRTGNRMQFIAQITDLLDPASPTALAAIGIVLVSMFIAVRAWRHSAIKVARLERALGELEHAQSQRLRKLEQQIAALQSGEPETAGNAPSKGSTPPFLTALAPPSDQLREAGDQHRAVASDNNIVPLVPTRAHGRNNPRDKKLSVEDLRQAIAENRFESCFQPIVALPGRAPRYYEASSRLRSKNNSVVPSEQWQGGMAARECAGEIARAVLVECLGLARKLRREKREGSVIWTLRAEALANEHECERIMALLKANTSLRSRFIISLAISQFDNASGELEERWHRISEMGFSFALSGDRNLERITKSAKTGFFSLILMPHQTILTNSFERGTSVAAKLRAAAPQHHIEIAATGIELEETAMDLIDCDVMLVQGPLFSNPRPLRRTPGRSGDTASAT